MAQPYHFTFIDAPIETVWGVVFHEAETHGQILTMREPDLLVIEAEGLYSAYGLRQYPAMEGKMGLYLVLTHDRTAATELANAPDLFRALEALPIDVAPDVYETSKTHLQAIKTAAQQAAKMPRSEVCTPNAPKPSIDPNKAGMNRSELSFGNGLPVVPLHLAWIIFVISVLGFVPGWGLFLALSLLVLNWLGMGKRDEAFISAAASIVVWSVLIILIQGVFLPHDGSSGVILTLFIAQIIIAAGLIFWQIRRQKPAYTQAVESYGKPSGWAFGNIAVTLTALLIGAIMGNLWPRVLSIPISELGAIIAAQRTYTDARLSFTYPIDWISRDTAALECDEQHVDCLLLVTAPDRSGMMFLQNNNIFGLFAPFEEAVQRDIQAIEADRSDLKTPTQTKLRIEGRDAIKYQYHYMVDSGDMGLPMIGTVLYMRDHSDLVRLYIYTPPRFVETADMIINSLHFAKYAD